MLENYGDVNFFEYGCLAEMQEESWVRVIRCRPIEADLDQPAKYRFSDSLIDISDTWISQKSVEEYADVKKDDDPVGYAIACLDYYGPENFYSRMSGRDEFEHDWNNCSGEEILKYLGDVDFAFDDLNFNGLPYDLTKVSGSTYICQLPTIAQDIVRNEILKYIKTLDEPAPKKEEILENALDGRLHDLEPDVNWRTPLQGLTLSGKRVWELPDEEREDTVR